MSKLVKKIELLEFYSEFERPYLNLMEQNTYHLIKKHQNITYCYVCYLCTKDIELTLLTNKFELQFQHWITILLFLAPFASDLPNRIALIC